MCEDITSSETALIAPESLIYGGIKNCTDCTRKFNIWGHQKAALKV